MSRPPPSAWAVLLAALLAAVATLIPGLTPVTSPHRLDSRLGPRTLCSRSVVPSSPNRNRRRPVAHSPSSLVPHRALLSLPSMALPAEAAFPRRVAYSVSFLPTEGGAAVLADIVLNGTQVAVHGNATNVAVVVRNVTITGGTLGLIGPFASATVQDTTVALASTTGSPSTALYFGSAPDVTVRRCAVSADVSGAGHGDASGVRLMDSGTRGVVIEDSNITVAAAGAAAVARPGGIQLGTALLAAVSVRIERNHVRVTTSGSALGIHLPFITGTTALRMADNSVFVAGSRQSEAIALDGLANGGLTVTGNTIDTLASAVAVTGIVVANVQGATVVSVAGNSFGPGFLQATSAVAHTFGSVLGTQGAAIVLQGGPAYHATGAGHRYMELHDLSFGATFNASSIAASFTGSDNALLSVGKIRDGASFSAVDVAVTGADVTALPALVAMDTIVRATVVLRRWAVSMAAASGGSAVMRGVSLGRWVLTDAVVTLQDVAVALRNTPQLSDPTAAASTQAVYIGAMVRVALAVDNATLEVRASGTDHRWNTAFGAGNGCLLLEGPARNSTVTVSGAMAAAADSLQWSYGSLLELPDRLENTTVAVTALASSNGTGVFRTYWQRRRLHYTAAGIAVPSCHDAGLLPEEAWGFATVGGASALDLCHGPAALPPTAKHWFDVAAMADPTTKELILRGFVANPGWEVVFFNLAGVKRLAVVGGLITGHVTFNDTIPPGVVVELNDTRVTTRPITVDALTPFPDARHLPRNRDDTPALQFLADAGPRLRLSNTTVDCDVLSWSRGVFFRGALAGGSAANAELIVEGGGVRAGPGEVFHWNARAVLVWTTLSASHVAFRRTSLVADVGLEASYGAVPGVPATDAMAFTVREPMTLRHLELTNATVTAIARANAVGIDVASGVMEQGTVAITGSNITAAADGVSQAPTDLSGTYATACKMGDLRGFTSFQVLDSVLVARAARFRALALGLSDIKDVGAVDIARTVVEARAPAGEARGIAGAVVGNVAGGFRLRDVTVVLQARTKADAVFFRMVANASAFAIDGVDVAFEGFSGNDLSGLWVGIVSYVPRWSVRGLRVQPAACVSGIKGVGVAVVRHSAMSIDDTRVELPCTGEGIRGLSLGPIANSTVRVFNSTFVIAAAAHSGEYLPNRAVGLPSDSSVHSGSSIWYDRVHMAVAASTTAAAHAAVMEWPAVISAMDYGFVNVDFGSVTPYFAAAAAPFARAPLRITTTWCPIVEHLPMAVRNVSRIVGIPAGTCHNLTQSPTETPSSTLTVVPRPTPTATQTHTFVATPTLGAETPVPESPAPQTPAPRNATATPTLVPAPRAVPAPPPFVGAAADGGATVATSVSIAAASSASALSAVKSVGMLQTAQLCGGRDKAAHFDRELPVTMSPLRMSVGDDAFRYFRGAAVGNLLLIATFCLLAALAIAVLGIGVPPSLLLDRLEPLSSPPTPDEVSTTGRLLRAAAAVRCPGLLCIICSIPLLDATVSSAVTVVYHSAVSDDTVGGSASPGSDAFILALATVLVLLVLVYCFFVLRFRTTAVSDYVPLTFEDDAALPYRMPRPLWGILMPAGEWRELEGKAAALRRHATLFIRFRPAMRWLLFADIAATFAAAVIRAFAPDGCDVVSWLLAVVHVAFALSLTVCRPMNIVAKSGLSALGTWLLAAGTVCIAAQAPLGVTENILLASVYVSLLAVVLHVALKAYVMLRKYVAGHSLLGPQRTGRRFDHDELRDHAELLNIRGEIEEHPMGATFAGPAQNEYKPLSPLDIPAKAPGPMDIPPLAPPERQAKDISSGEDYAGGLPHVASKTLLPNTSMANASMPNTSLANNSSLQSPGGALGNTSVVRSPLRRQSQSMSRQPTVDLWEGLDDAAPSPDLMSELGVSFAGGRGVVSNASMARPGSAPLGSSAVSPRAVGSAVTSDNERQGPLLLVADEDDL